MEKIPFHQSLRFRIIFLVIGLALFAAVMTSIYYLKQIESITVFEIEHEGLLLSDLLETSIGLLAADKNIKEMQAFIDRLVSVREKNDIEINVMLIRGDRSDIVASNIPDNIEETSPDEHASLIASLENSQPVIFIARDNADKDDEKDEDLSALGPDDPDYYFPPGQRFLSITTPLIEGNGGLGSINIKLSLAVFDRKIKTIRHSIYAASVAEIILLMMTLIFFLNSQFLGPLNTMVEDILNIGRNGIERRLTIDARKDEFGILAREFNRMMDRIKILITEMRDMADNIAHDLKNPITRIRGAAEVALTADSSMDEFAAMTASTIEECDAMLMIINSMLYISAAEAGALEIERTAVDIGDVVRKASELFQPAAEALNIGLKTVTREGCYVNGNLQMLQRVISNLLDNALKYTPPGGSVRMEMSASNDKVQVHVADTGIGIAENELPLIFDRFYRCDRSRSQPGVGLGLSLIQAILKLHRGEIAVSSVVDGGSTFTISLPCMKPDGKVNGA